LGDNIDTINKNTETLIDVSMDVGLVVNVETNYTLAFHHQNAGQNWSIKIANRWFENVSQFKHLRKTVISQNLIPEEMKKRLNCGSAYYHSSRNVCPSSAVKKMLKLHYTRL
jgi:hypothetical protein